MSNSSWHLSKIIMIGYQLNLISVDSSLHLLVLLLVYLQLKVVYLLQE